MFSSGTISSVTYIEPALTVIVGRASIFRTKKEPENYIDYHKHFMHFILNKTKLIDCILYFNYLTYINTYVFPMEYSII